ncbi:MAG: sugar phosphate isomerase/epimerase family protein [Actinomycetota bacterium]|nr:sugar phosphate isomerase/epimerase family protein [Actinomycetota bacterium]
MPLLGVDTYTFHRRFSVERAERKALEEPWTIADLVRAVGILETDIVSYQTMFLPDPTRADCAEALEVIRTGPPAMFSWGGDLGLDGGRRPDRLHELTDWCHHSEAIGASLMRIVVGGPRTRLETSFEGRVKRLAPLLREACSIAEDCAVSLAIETHADNTVAELLEIIDAAGNDRLGIVLDVANAVRVLDDPLAALDVVGRSLKMVHIRDIPAEVRDQRPCPGEPCVPPGHGSLPLVEMLDHLRAADFDGVLALEYVALTEDWPDEVEAVRAGMTWLRSSTTEWSTT